VDGVGDVRMRRASDDDRHRRATAAVHRAGCVAAAIAAACGAGCGAKPPIEPAPAAPPYAGSVDLAGVDASVLRNRRILIDPGHGGRFDGTTGRDRSREADVNLGVALYLWGLLRDAGADVHLTRHSDRDLLAGGATGVRDDLAARVAILDSLAPDVFLSLHHNSHATLDRERNAIETYYKLDDDGPSYDLGRAIHAELVRHLGIAEARLRPGNYFVLRGARTAAVLGEASYLSHPVVESQLQLAGKQRLEAAAYFRGLVDYFAHGVAAIDKRAPAGDTLRADGALEFAVGEAVDPASVEVTAGDRRLPVRIEPGGHGFGARAAVPPGAHRIEARARLARGNAARPWRRTIVVHAPAAHAFLTAEPAAAGGRVRLHARLVDAEGRPVGDGTPIAWRTEHAILLDAEPAVADGEAAAVVQTQGGAARVHVVAGGARAMRALTADVPATTRLVRCVDARDAHPLADAWGADGATSDRRGWLPAALAGELAVERSGYEPWQGPLPPDSTLRLVPLHGGVLHAVRFVLDPAGDGGDPALAGSTFAAADVDHDVCSRLAAQLNAAGAHATLTRPRAGTASDLERVRAAAGADWFVRVEATNDADAPAVLHYPGSEGGARLAVALAAALAARGGAPVAVRAEARFVLQQTPCPAVWLRVPPRGVATLGARRDLAYALGVGARVALDPSAAAWPPLVGRVEGTGAEVVLLDGADAVPVQPDGRFRFEHVAPGTRRLAVVGEAPRAVAVVASGQDTTRVVVAR
jgi:N-acetylmuramoyl-L-alanine amidase